MSDGQPFAAPLRIALVAAAVGIGLVVWGGFQPDGYLIQVLGVDEPIPYPVSDVAIYSGITLAESLAFLALVRFIPNRIAGPFAAFVLGFGLMIFWGMGATHAPPFFLMHFWWLLFVSTALFLLTLARAVRRMTSAWS